MRQREETLVQKQKVDPIILYHLSLIKKTQSVDAVVNVSGNTDPTKNSQ